MNKDKKEFILHIAGLIVLTFLAVFFSIIEAKYNVEITDVGIVIGIIGSIVGNHAVQRIKQGKEDATTE